MFLGLLALALVASLGVTRQVTASATVGPDVRVSELTNGGPGGSSDNFIELANYGDEPADLDGWKVWRCTGTGGTGAVPQAVFSDVTLAPGDMYMIAHEASTVAHLADELYDTSLADAGFGVWLEDGERRRVDVVDAVGVYAAPTDSECGGTSLPNDLDYRRGQSYQRVGTSGVVTADFVKAARTPNAPNASLPDPEQLAGDVLISELTNGGPAGSSDNFIEIANFGGQLVDVSGWEIYRCTGTGRRQTGTLQASLPQGTVLEPGGVFVAAHESVVLPDGVANVRYSTSLANVGFGALIEDAEGNVMDAVGVFESDNIHQPPTDSPCTQGNALPNRLDFGFDETYQRFQHTGDNAADFVKAPRTVGEFVIHDPDDFPDEPFEFGPVRISELTNGGPSGSVDNFFELTNYGDEPVSLEGWTIYRCGANGRRVSTAQMPVISDVILEPDDTFLAVRSGSPLHHQGQYDAVYATSFSGDGFGLMVFDADVRLVDSVGVYDPVGNVGQGGYSACTKGLSAPNTLDTAAGHSYQRLQSTGSDVDDLVAAPRTPGELATDLRAPWDIPEADLEPVDVAPNPRPLAPSLVAPGTGSTGVARDAELTVTAGHTTGADVEVVFRGAQRLEVVQQAAQAFIGVTDETPPAQRRPRGERRVPREEIPLDSSRDPLVAEATEGFPYQRYELTVSGPLDGDEVEVVWSGRSVGRNELQLYAWNHADEAWRLLDAGGGVTGGEITLIGSVDPDTMMRGRVVDVLVQDGPATGEAFSDEGDEPNLAFKDPGEYDFSFGFMTDTQFLSEGYRNVYAELNRWLVTNEDARKIAYTFHTGDLIESWTRGTHPEVRARDEFEFASNVMTILEEAGHPHGVTPGNHDNKWGRSNDLYNEYFPSSRYEDQPWYGGSWREGDNQNHYDIVEIGGAEFLMLYLGYLSGDEAIDWANQVLAEHPDHNAIFATHEYINPDGSLATPDDTRWTSLGDRYWEEVILPNENVFLALSGHVLGVALNIKRNVGGVEGRTVVEMMANYQNFERDGRRDTGFLRLLQIDVDSKTMAVNTYSPAHEEHNAWQYDPERRYDDSHDEFTIEIDLNDIFDKRVETDLLGVQNPSRGDPIGVQQVSDGNEATVTWSGLSPNTTYGWYVEARDAGGASVRSPVWTFVTQD